MDDQGGLSESGQCLETVRALHKTVVSLRQALEQSRSEILELKNKGSPLKPVEEVLKNLSIENHILRQKIVCYEGKDSVDTKDDAVVEDKKVQTDKHVLIVSPRKEDQPTENLNNTENIVQSTTITKSPTNTKHNKPTTKNDSAIQYKLKTPTSDKAKSITDNLPKTIVTSRNTTKPKLNKTSDSANKKPESINKHDKVTFDTKSITNLAEKQSQIAQSTKKADTQKQKQSKVSEEKNIFSTSINTEGKKHVIDVKIDVNVVKQNRHKNISITIPTDINKNEEVLNKTEDISSIEHKINDETELNDNFDCETQNINEYTYTITNNNKVYKEQSNICNDRVFFDRNLSSSSTFDGSSLEKNEFEDINDDTENDIDEFENLIPDICVESPKSILQDKNFNSKSPRSFKNINFSPRTTDFSGKSELLSRSISKSIDNLFAKSPRRHSIISINDQEIIVETEVLSPRKISKSIENLILKSPETVVSNSKKLGFSKTLSFSNNSVKDKMANEENDGYKNSFDEHQDMDGDGEHEVDEVELIFTTDETKEEDFKEELVSIDVTTDGPHLQCPNFDRNISHESNLSAELEDDVFNDNFDNENQENAQFQTQTFDFTRENSQLYNSKSDNSINHEDKSHKSYYSYQDSSFENKSLEKDESFDRFEERVRIIETDISKVGIHDVEYSLGRRNTCPNPVQYKPILHREAIGKTVFGGRKVRPILAHSSAARKESGAQTDISALPGSSWRSESNLIHKAKIGDNFTTLPSKYPMPGNRLRLSEKTVEARRVLLSDIGFTSMVPELSRSADHLCPQNAKPPVTTTTTTCFGQFLRTPDLYSPGFQSQRCMWNNTATPSEGSHSQSRYSLCPLTSPPVPTRRCSAPVSPSRKPIMKHLPSKVRFANGSLPELRCDWNSTMDSGDSTDSLVEEAEHYLRRSIDCIASGQQFTCRTDTCKGSNRRASAPEPARDNIPPQGWQPFLPRVPRDLRLDHWVKVISPEGRVRGGRVRYVGPLVAQTEQFVGVQLSTPDGHSDGTYNGRRYFQCEPYHGIFVPFKKVVMGWRP